MSWMVIHILQIVVQLVEPPLPAHALRRQPTFRGRQRARSEPPDADAPVFPRSHQPARLEDFHVLEEGGECHMERTRQLRCAGGAPAETLDDGTPRRVGEGAEDRFQFPILRHSPNYTMRPTPGQLQGFNLPEGASETD